MNQYMVFDDCVAQYEGYEIYPTEWENFPIHHTDPFWNADLFDEPQVQDFSTDGFVFEVNGDAATDDVLLRASIAGGYMLLGIRNARGHRLIWLEQATVKAFRDFINTTK